MTNPAPTPIDYQVGLRLVDGNDVQYVVVAVTTRVVVTKKVVSGAVETAIPGFCNRKYRVAKVPAALVMAFDGKPYDQRPMPEGC